MEHKSINLDEVGEVNTTRSFEDYNDKHGRTTYVMEFPDCDFHVTFETKRPV